jgi:transcriptional regulator with XRE-family HTH domain
MQQDRSMQPVINAIERAAAERKWSLNKLAQAIGVHVTSLERWKSGATRSYDLQAVVKLFELAGMSMDEEFGLHQDAHGGGRQAADELTALRADIDMLKAQQQLHLSRLQQLLAEMLGNPMLSISVHPHREPLPEDNRNRPSAQQYRDRLDRTARDALAQLDAASDIPSKGSKVGS